MGFELASRLKRLQRSALSWVVYPLWLFPGLGHLMAGQRRRGLFFLATVAFLLVASTACFATTLGQLLFGLALSFYAYGLYDLTGLKRRATPFWQAVSMGAILVALLVLLWPAVAMLCRHVAPSLVRGAHSANVAAAPSAKHVLALVACFVTVLWISLSLSDRARRKRSAG
ncbi:hypothetical protein ACFL59_03600 [Planctomycetota bacterium]